MYIHCRQHWFTLKFYLKHYIQYYDSTCSWEWGQELLQNHHQDVISMVKSLITVTCALHAYRVFHTVHYAIPRPSNVNRLHTIVILSSPFCRFTITLDVYANTYQQTAGKGYWPQLEKKCFCLGKQVKFPAMFTCIFSLAKLPNFLPTGQMLPSKDQTFPVGSFPHSWFFSPIFWHDSC